MKLISAVCIHFAGQYLSQNHRFFLNSYLVHSLLGLQAKVNRVVLFKVLLLVRSQKKLVYMYRDLNKLIFIYSFFGAIV
jgi:hypothetical protein